MILNKENYSIQPFLDTHEVKGLREQHLDYVCENYLKEGDYFLEFGVWKGGTINRVADRFPNQEIHGFDSFEGLPEKWYQTKRELETDKPRHTTDTFSLGALPKVRQNVTLHKGYFENVLPNWLSARPNNWSLPFLHIDSDLYSSAKYVLTTLNDCIKIDTVIVFDDFYRWDKPNVYELWEDGEYKALKEWIEENDREVEVLCRSEIGWQTTVRVVK